MKKTIFTLFGCLPLLGLAQFHLYSDFYISGGTELHISAPLTTFDSGSFITEHGPLGGVVSFASTSQWEAADHSAHVDGNVKTYSPTAFVFPTGHDGVFQPMAISDASGVQSLQVDYRHMAHTNLFASAGLIKIHPAHYWQIDQGSGTAKVALSWNEFSNLDSFLEGERLDDLTLVGYSNGAWILIPSSLNPNTTNTQLSGSITSDASVALDSYTSLALAVKGIIGPDGMPSDLPIVAEGISPNGDGKNDAWVIQGIERFPTSKVNVYNRNGENVYEARNGYNNDWIGDWKNTGKTLPSGPYFYTLDLDNDGYIDLQGWLFIQN